MRVGYTKGFIKTIDKYIDVGIEDATLREIFWAISVYTLTEQWADVFRARWRLAEYLQSRG